MSKNTIEWKDEWEEPHDNEGYLLCSKCRARMSRLSRPDTRTENVVCPKCGYEYIVEYWDDEEDDEDEEWTPDLIERYGGDVPPAGCRAC